MTRQDLTHIYFLLDRSGSMQLIKHATEAGFAGFIRDQNEVAGACRVTLAQFDNTYEVVYSGVPVGEVKPLALQPRGSTALLDAMGTLITDAGTELAALPEDDRPGTVIVAIMTDGHENASKEWTREAIRSLVEQQTTQYSWQFLYMGAEQDAVEVGTSLGVNPEHSVSYGLANAQELLSTTSGKVSAYRSRRSVDPNAVMAGYTSDERSALHP